MPCRLPHFVLVYSSCDLLAAWCFLMAAPSVDLQPLAPDTPSSRPSLRRRLFSPPTWKSPKQPIEEPLPLTAHPLEQSSSTSSKQSSLCLSMRDNLSGLLATVTPDAHLTHEAGVSNLVAQDTLHGVDAKASPAPQPSVQDPPTASKNKRTVFYRRKVNQSAIADANLSSNSHSPTKPRQRTSRPKASFLTRVVHKVVPCVSPTLDPSSGEGDDTASGAPSPGLQDVDAHSRDKESYTAEEPAGVVTVPVIHVDPPSTAMDVSPISFQDAPADETGLTSSAVQPPGCIVDVSKPVNSRDSSQDFDSDDEGDDDAPVLSEQEQEERLIRNGGAGIPIGPVGHPLNLSMPFTNQLYKGWPSKASAPPHNARACWTKMSSVGPG